MVVRDGAALQQQTDDLRVGRAGHRAAQWCPATAAAGPSGGAAARVGSGVQQQPRHGQQAAGPGRVEGVPPRGAGRVQRRPAGPGVDAGGQAGVPGELGADPGSVAEDHRGGEVVTGQLRAGGQHPGGATCPIADAGLAEHLGLPGQVRGAGLDLGLEPRPAREAVFAGQGQLRAGQGPRGGNRPDAADGPRVARLRGAQQVAGLAAQVVQAGTGRKIGHDVSFTACDPRGGPTREIAVSCKLVHRGGLCPAPRIAGALSRLPSRYQQTESHPRGELGHGLAGTITAGREYGRVMPRPDRSSDLDHVAVIVFENRSSDNLLGRLLDGEARPAKARDAIRSSRA